MFMAQSTVNVLCIIHMGGETSFLMGKGLVMCFHVHCIMKYSFQALLCKWVVMIISPCSFVRWSTTSVTAAAAAMKTTFTTVDLLAVVAELRQRWHLTHPPVMGHTGLNPHVLRSWCCHLNLLHLFPSFLWDLCSCYAVSISILHIPFLQSLSCQVFF